MGDFIRKLHEEHGVIFHLEDTSEAIAGSQVKLKSGGMLDANLVVVGVGVRPRIALAEQAGLAMDQGVKVDALLQTSAPNIFAAGDIARWPDPHTAENIRVEHWVVAERQGQTAALNMLGLGQRYTAVPFFWSQHYDIPINYVGHAEKWDDIAIEGDIAHKDCILRYRRGGKVLAVASIFRDRESLQAEMAMERAALKHWSGHCRNAVKDSRCGEAPWRSNTAVRSSLACAPSRRTRQRSTTPLELTTRMRRNRKSEWARRMVRENVLTADDLIWPLFVVDGANVRVPVASMPASSGCRSIRRCARRCARADSISRASRCFPTPIRACATKAAAKRSIPTIWSVRRSARSRKKCPTSAFLCDVALDPYTSHGHDGLMRGTEIVNDETSRCWSSRRWSKPKPAATSSRHPT
jgi:hypothetical protein